MSTSGLEARLPIGDVEDRFANYEVVGAREESKSLFVRGRNVALLIAGVGVLRPECL